MTVDFTSLSFWIIWASQAIASSFFGAAVYHQLLKRWPKQTQGIVNFLNRNMDSAANDVSIIVTDIKKSL
jgi:hypothetical protein